MAIYNVNGISMIDNGRAEFLENVTVDFAYDTASATNYTVIRIYQTRVDGNKQFPFVYAPNGTSAGNKSTLAMNRSDKWYIAINAGVFSIASAMAGHSNVNEPLGILIEDGTVLQNGPAGYATTIRKPLTIDSDGMLGCVADDADTATLIANGVVSAVCGFGSIIENYVPTDYTYIPNYTAEAQRQIIGQFGNGDYAIITCEGNSYNHSDGWTIAEAVAVCQKLGLKFAYNLDGGGSTETVIGEKQLNTIYEGTSGRVVPTYIVFNGSDIFAVPTE